MVNQPDLCFITFVLFCLILVLDSISAKDVTLTILHTNDVHDRIDEFNVRDQPCTPQLREDHQCFGGIARQKFLVEKIRKENRNSTLFLDGGDFSMGTMWFYLFKAKIVADSLQLLKHDAVALGNHEFDGGSKELEILLSRLDESSIPVLGCNIDFSKNPILRKYQPKKSMIVQRSGVQIGLIGYLTPDTMRSSRVDNGTLITDEIECIARESEILHQKGVKIIIVVGHSGYSKDIEIAQKVPLVNVVVGGHSHTYLSSVDHHTGDKIMGPYPTVIMRQNGNKALVVQDFWMGKYLGRIDVSFDAETGRVRSWEGDTPILLDRSIPKDADVEAFVEKKRAEVDKYANSPVGFSLFELSNVNCRRMECGLGNLVAESISDYFVVKNLEMDNFRWKTIDIAIVNAGAMRSSLHKGPVTAGDVAAMYPYSNSIWVLTVSGADVKRMYEISFRGSERQSGDSYGGFLHSAGTRVVADITRKVNDRIISVEILCTDCPTVEWHPLDLKRSYRIAMADYIALGGSMYEFANISSDNVEKLTVRDTELVSVFIEKSSPIHPFTDGRIKILTANDKQNCGPSNSNSAGESIQQNISFFMVVSAVCSVMLVQQNITK